MGKRKVVGPRLTKKTVMMARQPSEGSGKPGSVGARPCEPDGTSPSQHQVRRRHPLHEVGP
jgi:hypothetical protein